MNPYIGWSEHRPEFTSNEEVAALIPLPLGVLQDPAAKGIVTRKLDGRLVEVPCYRYHEYIIWGATAMILSGFEAVLARISPT